MNDTKEQTKQNLDQILEWVFIQLDIADVEKAVEHYKNIILKFLS